MGPVDVSSGPDRLVVSVRFRRTRSRSPRPQRRFVRRRRESTGASDFARSKSAGAMGSPVRYPSFLRSAWLLETRCPPVTARTVWGHKRPPKTSHSPPRTGRAAPMSAKNVQFVPQLGPVSRYCSRSRGGISVASCAAGLPVNAAVPSAVRLPDPIVLERLRRVGATLVYLSDINGRIMAYRTYSCLRPERVTCRRSISLLRGVPTIHFLIHQRVYGPFSEGAMSAINADRSVTAFDREDVADAIEDD